ncbi:MAG: 2-hydroxychromene-2-carboxylate isomerase [Kiloniellales bacterium]
MAKQLEFLYDIVSVPSYLAWTQLPAVTKETRARLVQTPVFCGGIFQATGNLGPLGVPAKQKWYAGDLALWAKHLGVPLNSSPHWPIHSLPIMRGVFVAEERGELEVYLKTMFEANFIHARNLNEANEVRNTLVEAGLDADTYFAEIQRDDIKARLRKNTDDAVARGAFGVPTFFVGDQMFFGQDRLHFVKEALKAS